MSDPSSGTSAKPTLARTVTLPRAVALYVAAVVGAGVLILPGLAASAAGPASVVSWAFVSLLGVPLALSFAALASRYPDAGGVSTFVSRAFGPAAGWFYFFTGATGLVVVPLTGAYYAADPLGLGRDATFLIAGTIIASAVGANLLGLGTSGALALVLSGGVVLLLLAATVFSLPRMSAENWTPFAPEGWGAVGRAGVLVFFAYFGWEAIAQLSEEFEDPARDVPRATSLSVGVVTLLYVGVAVATVGTATYGSPGVDRVSVARLLGDAPGFGAGGVAALMALVISLGTANAYVAATSRLGYSLARDGSFPRPLAGLDRRGVPGASVLAVGALVALGLAVSYAARWGADSWLAIPNSLGIATYVVGGAAGARPLRGAGRWMALASCAMCVAVFSFAGAFALLPLAVALAAILYRRMRCRGSPPGE